MDSVVTPTPSVADDRFDTARITAAVDALAAKHSGREDVFRTAVAQLLKAEMAEREVRSTAYQLKAARFPVYRDLAGFDFDRPTPKPGRSPDDKRRKLAWARRILGSLEQQGVRIEGA